MLRMIPRNVTKVGLRSVHTSGVRYNTKSPYQVFVDTFKAEWNKSKELQDNIKALQDETGKMSESDAYRKAKEAYDRAQAASSVTTETLKKAGKAVGNVASNAWESPIVKSTRDAVNTTADQVERVTGPIRETEVYKQVKDVIDDGSSRRYGGFERHEDRLKRRAIRDARLMKDNLERGIMKKKSVTENPEAGSNVIVHENAKVEGEDGWFGSIKAKIEESENPIVSSFRAVSSRLGNMFAETEYASVMRMFKEMDPTFSSSSFLVEAREYIVPEIIDAYVNGDEQTLRTWLAEVQFIIWEAQAKSLREAGLTPDGRVLDIRNVEITRAQILPETEVPVLVLSCRAQEINIYRNFKTGEIAAGTEDHIQESTYVMAMTRLEDEMDNPETRGWTVLQFIRGQTRDWT
ncbi:hypothetical protein V1512DRAFT_261108 [Lipomyces arxii]|uniref:uncharacterized protein n=1 Tax=Lipomyces arxii TaxID=56418 RepID=UPI0034CF5370